MSTASFPGALGPVLVKRFARESPSALAGRPAQGRADLTIHRITETHHGRTLLLLGHAAEHLANSRRYTIHGLNDGSEAEAIHILLGLSRDVFDEFARQQTRRWKAEQWLLGRVAGLIEGRAGRKGRGIAESGAAARELRHLLG